MSAPTATSEVQQAPAAKPRGRSGHLHQIDMVRVIAFSFVIFAHVVNGVNQMDDPDIAAISMSMHFTRNTFFFLTALVLVYGYRDRNPGVTKFWRKRIGVVAVPYLIWSAIYTAINAPDAPLGAYVHALVKNLITGGAMFQLYFLVVSIQFYLIFPLFLAILKALRNWPVATLAGAVAIQFFVNSFEAIDPPPFGQDTILGRNWPSLTAILPSYLVYFVIGGLVAMHLEKVTEWVRGHLWHLVGFAALGVSAMLFNYYGNIDAGMHPFGASNALQPSVMLWAVPAVLLVYAIGVRWADRRQPGSVADKILSGGTERAFGIFLVHPLILAVLYDNIVGELIAGFGMAGATIITYLLGVAGSVLLVEVLRRTPWAKKLVGRPPVPFISERAKQTMRKLVTPRTSG